MTNNFFCLVSLVLISFIIHQSFQWMKLCFPFLKIVWYMLIDNFTHHSIYIYVPLVGHV